MFPLHTLENMFSYLSTKSKVIAKLNGGTSPGGGYDYLLSMLKSKLEDPLAPPKTFGVVCIDNDQRLTKNYNLIGNLLHPKKTWRIILNQDV